MSYNRATIVGRLGQDVELRYTQQDTAVANISLATSERYKDGMGEWQEKTTWHRVVLWGRKAEVANEYLLKGSQILVSGPIEKREYKDNSGVERTSVEIKAITMKMLDSKGESNAHDRKPVSSEVTGDSDELDQDLPF